MSTPYSPAGNHCSRCNVYDQWCPHIQPPTMRPDYTSGLRAALKIVEAERERQLELEAHDLDVAVGACDRIANQLKAELEK